MIRTSTVSLFAVLVAALAGPAAADGADVSIELHPDAASFASDLGLSTTELTRQIQDGIDGAIVAGNVRSFLRGLGDANAFTSRGIGADYASNGESLILGVGATVAADVHGVDEEATGDPYGGGAANLTIMAGRNLKHWGHRELTVFGNVFHKSYENVAVDAAITSVGAHVQYKVFTPTTGYKKYVAQWGGIDITTGFEVARWKVGINGEMERSFKVSDAGGETASLVLAGNGHMSLGSTTATIPLEVTSNLRLFTLLSVYGGAGVDLQVGRSAIDVGMGGSVTAVRGEDSMNLGAVQVNAVAAEAPSLLKTHALAGLQLNLWKVKVFTQATVSPDGLPSGTYALSLGMRVVL